jgi:hypothetical protein
MSDAAESTMRTILVEHNQRYPQWAIDDLYKLIHQSAMGSAHALIDERQVRNRLMSELSQLAPGPDEPLLDPISPNGRVVRIHLRPFTRLNLDREQLLFAFRQSARKITPSTGLLLTYTGIATKLCEDELLPFRAEEVIGFFEGLRSSGFPAVHHSRDYRVEYLPAYRIVLLDTLTSEILAAS